MIDQVASYRTVRYVLPLYRVVDGDERSIRGNRRNRIDGKKATKDPVGTRIQSSEFSKFFDLLMFHLTSHGQHINLA